MFFFDKLKKNYKIFKDINKAILKKPKFLFYSESKSYQKYIYLIIELFTKIYDDNIYYISSDKDDYIKNDKVQNIFIGDGIMRNYFFSFINAQNIFLTVTDLDNNLIKKNKNVENYIYYFHAAASTTKIYTSTAFDNYDIILCNGEFQINEIQTREAKKKLKEKILYKTGYFYFDYLSEKLNYDNNSDEILIAPSWNYNKKNYFNENFDLIIQEILDKGYKVRFRPHPENLKRSQSLLLNIKNKYIQRNFIFDDKPENIESMKRAKCLITDNSGIAIEYTLILKKPVIYFNDYDKIHNTEYDEYKNLMTIEEKIKNNFGYTFKINNLDQIDKIIETSIDNFKNKDKEINNFINENFYNFGNTINHFKEKIIKNF